MSRMYRASSEWMLALPPLDQTEDPSSTDDQIMYPLDVVKTRQQLSTDAKSMGIGATLRSIVAQEG